MSIFIVNDTTADAVSWTVKGVTTSGTHNALASGSLDADIQNNRFIFEPPASPVYSSFIVNFSPIAMSGTASAAVLDQSEVRLGMSSEISTSANSINGIQIANDVSVNIPYAVYGQNVSSSGRTLVKNGIVSSGAMVPISGASLAAYDFFDVELSGMGSSSGSSRNAKVTVQTDSKITFAVFHSEF